MITRRRAMALTAGAGAMPFIGGGTALAEAPMMGLSRPSIYRFEHGGFEIATLLDGASQLQGPHPIFGQDQDAEAVAELARANHLPADMMEIQFTPTLVNTGNELVLFDAGNGAGGRPNTGRLPAMLENAGYTVDQVDLVVVTHMHPDHIGGLMENGSPTFPNARYTTSEVEYDFWTSEERLSGQTEGNARLVQSNIVPLAEKTSFLKDGSEVVPGITAIAAFGHTPGHMAFHIESDAARLLLWADAANHSVVSVQRPDWHVRFDMDKEKAAEVRRRLFDMAEADRLPVTGYHMPFPALGYAEAAGETWRWVQTSYQLNL